MSDHLTSLVLRAVQPTRIHRRMRSRFESDTVAGAGLEIISEDMAHSVEARTRPDMPTAVPTPQRHGPVSPGTLDREQQDAPSPGLPKEVIAPQVTVPPAILSQPSALPRPDLTPPPHQPQLRETVEPLRQQPAAAGERIERTVHEHRELRQEHVERRETLQQTLEQTVDRLVLLEPRLYRNAVPQRTAPAAPTPVQAEASMPAPRVEVSIGRIEVLAPPSSPARTQRDDAPRPPAAQSLETYLRRRSGSNGREEGAP